MKRFAVIAAALTLAACAHTNVAQIEEKADTDASFAYAAIATSLNAYEAAHPAGTQAAEALKMKAWLALMVERQAYAAGKTVDLSAFTAIAAEAKALGA